MHASIDVAHPAPVLLHASRRARPKLVMARMTTRVDVVSIAPGSARVALALWDGGHPDLLRIDGEPGLWQYVTCRGGEKVEQGEFLRFLSDEEPDGHRTPGRALATALLGTPLVAVRDLPNGETRRLRGDPAARLGGDVLRDGRDSAPEALRRLFSERIRLGQAGVLVRVDPFVEAQRRDGYGPSVWNVEPLCLPQPRLEYMFTPPLLPAARAGQALANWHAMDAGHQQVRFGKAAERLAGSGLAEAAGNADAVALANRLPGWALGRSEVLGLQYPEAGEACDGAWRERVRNYALRGMVGGIPADEAEDVLRLVAPRLVALAEAADVVDANDAHGIGSYVLHEILPRLAAAAALDPDDDAALEGLAP